MVLQFQGYLVMLAAKNLKHRLLKSTVSTKESLVRVVLKLKYHRLKPGGVHGCPFVAVVMKLKYHRLKPGCLPLIIYPRVEIADSGLEFYGPTKVSPAANRHSRPAVNCQEPF